MENGKVIPGNESPNKNEEMGYDVWIDINMKRICNKDRSNIEYINRKNRQPGKYEIQKLIDELKKLDLADANTSTATLTRKGEEVCKAGGWLEYLKQQNIFYSFFNTYANSFRIDTRYKHEEQIELNKRIDMVLNELEKLKMGQEILFEEIEKLKEKGKEISKKDLALMLIGQLVSLGTGKIDSETIKFVFENITGIHLTK